MTFEMPESYRAYCADRAVRTAVDHILSAADRKGGLAVPAAIGWEDLPAFHKAVLSAQMVRCEYAIFLIDIWDAVWRPAMDECGFRNDLRPRTVAESETWCEGKLDTNTVWDNEWFGRCFDIGDANWQLGLGVVVTLEGVQLNLCFCEAEYADLTTETDFGEGWEHGIEVGWAYTGKDLAPIPDEGPINLDRLRKAAANALAVVAHRTTG